VKSVALKLTDALAVNALRIPLLIGCSFIRIADIIGFIIFSPQGIFRMIRDGGLADHGTFRKATKEIFERYNFLKRALAMIR
jgi:hypothetical protein